MDSADMKKIAGNIKTLLVNQNHKLQGTNLMQFFELISMFEVLHLADYDKLITDQLSFLISDGSFEQNMHVLC